MKGGGLSKLPSSLSSPAGLALACPVERRGVEQVKAQCEGAVDDLDGLFVGYIAVEPADGGAAQAQAGDFEAAAAEDGFFAWIHCALPECVVWQTLKYRISRAGEKGLAPLDAQGAMPYINSP